MRSVIILFLFTVLCYAGCQNYRDRMISVSEEGYAKGNILPEFWDLWVTYKNQIVQGKDLGSGLSIHRGNCLIARMHGGNRTNAGSKWKADTLANAWSCSKGVFDIVLPVIQSKYHTFQWNDTISSHWPAFAAFGKGNITIEQLTSFQGGLPAIFTPFYNSQTTNHTFMDNIVEGMFPLWTPGTAFGYHPFSIGWLIDGLVRRLDPYGRTTEEAFTDLVLPVLGSDAEWYSVLPDDYDVINRKAELANETSRYIFNAQGDYICSNASNPALYTACRVYRIPDDFTDIFASNNNTFAKGYNPAGRGYTTPETVSKYYGILSSKKALKKSNLLNKTEFNTSKEVIVSGFDIILQYVRSISRAGWESPYGTNNVEIPSGRQTFGVTGAGGQICFADEEGFGFSYLTRDMFFDSVNSNSNALVKKFYEIITSYSFDDE